MSPQDLLAAVEQVIAHRLSGDAYVEYTATTQRFRGETLESLMNMRTRLQQEIAATSGRSFALAEPFTE